METSTIVIPVYSYDTRTKEYVFKKSISSNDVNAQTHVGGLIKGSRIFENFSPSNIISKVAFSNPSEIDCFLNFCVQNVPPFWPCLLENEPNDRSRYSDINKICFELQKIRSRNNVTSPLRYAHVPLQSRISSPDSALRRLQSDQAVQQLPLMPKRLNKRFAIMLLSVLGLFCMAPYFMYLYAKDMINTNVSKDENKNALNLFEKEELIDSLLWINSGINKLGSRYFISNYDDFIEKVEIHSLSPVHPSFPNPRHQSIQYSSFISGIPDCQLYIQKLPHELDLVKISISIPVNISAALLPSIIDTSKINNYPLHITKFSGFIKVGDSNPIKFSYSLDDKQNTDHFGKDTVNKVKIFEAETLKKHNLIEDSEIDSKRYIIETIVSTSQQLTLNENHYSPLKWRKIINSDTSLKTDFWSNICSFTHRTILSNKVTNPDSICQYECIKYNLENSRNMNSLKNICNALSVISKDQNSINCTLYGCSSEIIKRMLEVNPSILHMSDDEIPKDNVKIESNDTEDENNTGATINHNWSLSRFSRSLSINIGLDSINDTEPLGYMKEMLSQDVLVYLLDEKSSKY